MFTADEYIFGKNAETLPVSECECEDRAAILAACGLPDSKDFRFYRLTEFWQGNSKTAHMEGSIVVIGVQAEGHRFWVTTDLNDVVTIKCKRTPDGYRGDLSCLKIVSPHEKGKWWFCGLFPGGNDIKTEIEVEGKVVGILENLHGNNGYGADACDVLHLARGVQVEYVD